MFGRLQAEGHQRRRLHSRVAQKCIVRRLRLQRQRRVEELLRRRRRCQVAREICTSWDHECTSWDLEHVVLARIARSAAEQSRLHVGHGVVGQGRRDHSVQVDVVDGAEGRGVQGHSRRLPQRPACRQAPDGRSAFGQDHFRTSHHDADQHRRARKRARARAATRTLSLQWSTTLAAQVHLALQHSACSACKHFKQRDPTASLYGQYVRACWADHRFAAEHRSPKACSHSSQHLTVKGDSSHLNVLGRAKHNRGHLQEELLARARFTRK